MADNLTVSIGLDTSKMRADAEIAKAQLRGVEAEMQKIGREVARTGERTRLDQLGQEANALRQGLILTNVAIKEQERALQSHARTAAVSVRVSREVAKAHTEAAESSTKATREFITMARELGHLEVSGFGVARALKEIPTAAIPIAATAAAIALVGKATVDTADAAVKLNKLFEATGNSKENILALGKAFTAGNIEAAKLEPFLRQASEAYNKARFEAPGGLASAMTGGLVAPRAGGRTYGPGPDGPSARPTPGQRWPLSGIVVDDYGRQISPDMKAKPFTGGAPAYDTNTGEYIGRYLRPTDAQMLSPDQSGAAWARQVPRGGIEGEGQTAVFRGDQPMEMPQGGAAGAVGPQATYEKTLEAQAKYLAALDKTNHDLAVYQAGKTPGFAGMGPEDALRLAHQLAGPEKPVPVEITRPEGDRIREVPLGGPPREVPLGAAEAAAPRAAVPDGLAPFREEARESVELRPDVSQRAESLQRQLKRTQESVDQLEYAGGAPRLEGATNIAKTAEEGAVGSKKALEATGEYLDNLSQKMKADLETGPNEAEVRASAQSFQDTWSSTLQSISDKAKEVFGGMAAPPAAEAPVPPPSSGNAPPMASGGTVPGSGSGDTVPAWLTPGEYVARRSSVAYYGAALFSALNNQTIPRGLFSRMGFAVGGMVGDVGSFADGGLASSSGGTPVHLHLGGHQFAMSAAPAVAAALVAEAGRYQMRSAGIKPSWYGGRPSG